MTAKFITLEGIDGAGKSTHLAWLEQFIRKRGIEVIVTREPGGTPLGESLREILLHQSMHPETEALLMFAARREHLDKKILPALKSGTWVISDRFSDASYAYQGGGKGIPKEKLTNLELWAQGDFQPDLTLLFDVPIEVGIARVKLASKPDKFESEKQAFFQHVRDAYVERAMLYPNRFRVVDSSQSVAIIQERLREILLETCF